MADHDVLDRLTALERRYRRLQATCLVLVLCTVALGAGTDTVPDVLRAHHLEIVDPEGKPVATLSNGRKRDGVLLNGQVTDGVELPPGLVVWTVDNRMSSGVWRAKGGAGVVTVYGPNPQAERVRISVEEGSGSIATWNKGGVRNGRFPPGKP